LSTEKNRQQINPVGCLVLKIHAITIPTMRKTYCFYQLSKTETEKTDFIF